MKLFSTVLAAALVAGSCTVAMAQGAGGAGAADTSTQATPKQDPDKNPTGPAANPAAGNSANSGHSGKSGMTTAPVSGTRKPGMNQPNTNKDTPPGGPGTGGVK